VPGGSAAFQVSATSQPATILQWFHGETPLAGGTGSKLELANVTTAQGGLYRLVLRNQAGGIVSRAARLTVAHSIFVLPSPLNGAIVRSQGFPLKLMLESGRLFRVQFTDAVGAAPWVDLTNFTGAGAALEFLDAAAASRPQRFYRVVSP
jgi:hypothetical protein